MVFGWFCGGDVVELCVFDVVMVVCGVVVYDVFELVIMVGWFIFELFGELCCLVVYVDDLVVVLVK